MEWNSNKPKKLPQYISALAAASGATAAGCTITWLTQIQFKLESDGINGIVFTKHDSANTGSIIYLGAFIMCLPSGFICDSIGRKYAMLMMVAPLVLGWVLIIISQDIILVVVGRFITGLSLGTFSVAAPLYIAEIAHVSIRGELMTFFQLFAVLGILTMQITGYVFTVLVHTIIPIGLAIVFAVFISFQPESPFYLIKSRKMRDAELALKKLRGKDYDVQEEIETIVEYFMAMRSRKFCTSFRSKANVSAMVIVFGCQCIQQLSGINALGVYTADIFREAGVTNKMAPIYTILFAVVNLLSTYISTFFIDKVGRKTLLLISASLTALCVFIYGIFLMLKERKFYEEETINAYSIIPAITYVLYIAFFEVGLGPIAWVLAPELFPEDTKSILTSCAGVLNWGLAFLVAKFYVVVAMSLGSDICMFFFTACLLLGVIFICVCVFETKWKSMKEIQDILEKK